MRASYLDLDCNPAFLADEDKTIFRANIIGNDKLWQLNKYRQQLGDNDGISVANDLLQQSKPMVAKATASLWYQHQWWAVGYIPFRAGLAYTKRNPAYPEISAQVFKESELFAKAGLFSSDDHNLRIGLQGRYVQRDYIYQQFDAFDALSDPSIVGIQHQSALYLEPGIVYSWKSNWDPAISGTYTNLPLFQKGDQLPVQPIFDVGFSSSFGDLCKNLHTTTHITTRPDVTDIYSRLTWGATYDFEEHAAVNVLLGKNQLGIGVDGHLDIFTMGISYKTEELEVDAWRAVTISTITLAAGVVF